MGKAMQKERQTAAVPEANEDTTEFSEEEQEFSADEPASPQSLRKDKRLLREAAKRLDEVRLRELDDTDPARCSPLQTRW